ncbi:MAG: N-acetyltransferase [Clostridia bacterium]|nr:N-acetyltransferase [Clostridia bacterium]
MSDVVLRKARFGDEEALAAIQAGSWQAAFPDMVTDEIMTRYTDHDRLCAMFHRVIEQGRGTLFLLSVDGAPHCFSWWSPARDEAFAGWAEICALHSLPGHWRQGFGGMMMNAVLQDIRDAGYQQVLLWTFRENARARSFYEAQGFRFTGDEKNPLGTVEVRYERMV